MACSDLPSSAKMKTRTLKHAAVTAILVAEAFVASGESSATGRTSQMQISLTIENTCALDTHSFPPNLNRDPTRRVSVECTTVATPYDITLDARDIPSLIVPADSVLGVATVTVVF